MATATLEAALNSNRKQLVTMPKFLKTGKGFPFGGKEYVYSSYSAPEDDDEICGSDFVEVDNGVLTSDSDYSIAVVQFGDKRVPLINGDMEGYETEDEFGLNEGDGPTISYQCLIELLRNAPSSKKDKLTHSKVVEMLASGKIQLIAYTDDETRSKKPGPKERGFTKMGDRKWHRSGTVLFRYGDESWLIGQDEGTYFGVVLADHPKTIDAAFTSLMPSLVKNYKGKFPVLRQGEWFLVPVDKNRVPKESLTTFSVTTFNLPKDDPTSNDHIVECNDGRIMIDNGQFRIFVIGACIDHNEHSAIYTKNDENSSQWYEIVRNTAVRSVSVEGVD